MSSSSSSKHHSTSTSSPSPTSSPSNNSSSSGLGKTTTIIIAVVASVGGIILILLVYRFIRHRINRRGSAPLPPVQPIAHHREQQLAQFEDRKFNSSPLGNGSAWAQQQQQYLMTPAPMSGSTSDASLTHRSSSPSPNVSLLNHHEIALHDEIALDNEKPLPHPTPAFHGTSSSRDSSSSMGSVVERSSTPNSPLPETPTSAQSHSSIQPLTRSVRPRPSSMVSTTSRKSFAGTTNTIRGAPHGPHSNVQIVLPTPLAPNLSPYGHVGRGDDPGWLLGDGDTGSVRPRPDSRLSVVDKWAGMPVGRNEQEEEKGLSAKKERNTGSGVAVHADARDSISTSRTASTSSSHYSTSQFHPHKSPPPSLLRSSLSQHNNSPTRHGNGVPSIPPSSFRDHSRTPPPPAPPVPRVHNQFASAIRLDDDGSLEERRRPVSTQSSEARTRN